MSEINLDINALNWDKVAGLMPAIIQDHATRQVIMLGYMNKAALEKTLETKKITFYSRTKKRLWIKGETSRNYLTLVDILPDCDGDALLIFAKPKGPSCHLNNCTCFGSEDAPGLGILAKLETIIQQRLKERPVNSYVSSLFAEGIQRIAQKVGEEGVEVALASVLGVKQDIKNEAADLIFHLLILLSACQLSITDILNELKRRAG